MEPRPY